jgi:hypothetical protein
MGTLVYGERRVIDFDDRLLAHLQIVISAKLRRRESFYMSWREPTASGSGRVSIWLDPGIPLMFHYDNAKALSINREWLAALSESSNTASGLMITDEAAHLTNRPAQHSEA